VTATLPGVSLPTAGVRRVLVTGAHGFVGRALCAGLVAQGVAVTAVTRTAGHIDGVSRLHAVGSLTALSDWRPCLDGVDAVVHLAAVTHDGTRGADAAHFHAVNVDVSCALAAAARAAGIARFVYLSSIKVNGERSARADGVLHAFSAADTPAPQDEYGRSKLAAERGLTALWGAADGALTILRPPLVYGPGQKGNLPRLMQLVARQWPLPFGALNNRRSVIYIDNLVAAILCALGKAPRGVHCYTLADLEVSSAELVRAIARGLGVPARLFAVPEPLLRAVAHLPVLGPRMRRLTDSLVVDAQAIKYELGWFPATGFDEAMAITCAAWCSASQ
jgi:nucleoside-diphosphate-sugar epimerase